MAIASKQKRHTNTAGNQKRHGLHQKRNQKFLKTYWPYLPMVGIVGITIVANSIWSNIGSKKAVLGYTTDVSSSSLLQGTNDQRVANGLGSLSLNSALDSAAQSKANDMVARNYWSHNTPTGQTPWSFIINAGYSYQTAGENLAYGFDTSSQVIAGWMNSAEHRANILNTTYKDVGFGIADSTNYQNSGPETVIVAMYASPIIKSVPAPVAAPVTPKPTPPKATPAPQATTPTQTPAAQPTPASVKTVPQSPAITTSTPSNQPVNLSTIPEPPTEKVARIQVLAGGSAPWSMFALSTLATVGLVVFILRNGRQLQKVVVRSERFILKHPFLDNMLVLVIASGFLFSRTSGLIR